MPFSTRNALYLRISSWTVLPLYLYLDERHVNWMTDQTLQAVLADLRPKLVAKFHEEQQTTKKSAVEVHRGASYQFAFFFRKTDARHVVLLKKREFHLQPIQPPSGPSTIPTPAPSSKKRKRRAPSFQTDERLVSSDEEDDATPGPSTRPRRGASQVDYAEPAEELDNAMESGEVEMTPLREVPEGEVAMQPVQVEAAEGEEVHVKEEPVDAGEMGETLEQVEEEEEEGAKNMKPVMKLSYTGFSISSRHLVLIIEPYPALPIPPKGPLRPRSTFSRSMSRDIGMRSGTSMSSASGFGGSERGDTPMIPNSRRGGTGTASATPGFGAEAGRGETPVPNSRSGGRVGDMGPPASLRSATPLFREATPMTDAGSDSDEEDYNWRARARGSSWSPWRKESEGPEGEEEDVEEAKGMLAMSQSLMEHAGRGVVGGADGEEEDGGEEGEEGEGGGRDDEVGGAE